MKFIIFSLIILNTILSISQTESHVGHNHDLHKNEIGIANAPVYFLKEKEISYGLHLHYIRNIYHAKFGIGLGYERIFDDHKHSTVGLVFAYRPINRLSFIASPGLTKEVNEPDLRFGFHIETSYEFELKSFHLGPVLEFAYDPEDIHLSLGLHLGYGF